MGLVPPVSRCIASRPRLTVFDTAPWERASAQAPTTLEAMDALWLALLSELGKVSMGVGSAPRGEGFGNRPFGPWQPRADVHRRARCQRARWIARLATMTAPRSATALCKPYSALSR